MRLLLFPLVYIDETSKKEKKPASFFKGMQTQGTQQRWDQIDGVNITLGLPIIRTSPDHGVAFGKAGKNKADPTSMISAIKLALELIKNTRRNSERS